jgi:hypothetical protein
MDKNILSKSLQIEGQNSGSRNEYSTASLGAILFF